MKRFFLMVIILSAATGSFAQVNQTADHATDKQSDLLGQGKIHIGVGFNGGYGGSFVGITGRVVPRVQYFLKDGWSVALEGRYQANGDFFRHLGAGLSTRYYFIRDRRLAVFGQVGATYGRSRYLTYYPGADLYNPNTWHEHKDNVFQVSAGLGIHYRIANRWSLEAVAERPLTNVGAYRGIGRWQGSLGVNFKLGK